MAHATKSVFPFYPCDAMLARYILSSCVRPSVGLSQVGDIYENGLIEDHANNAACTMHMMHDSPRTLNFIVQKLRNSDGITPNGGAKCTWMMWIDTVINSFFYRTRSLRLRRLTAKNLCPSVTVVPVHGPRPQQCAGRGIH